MKKILLLGVIVCVSIGVVFANGDTENSVSDGPVTLDVLSYGDNSSADSAAFDVLLEEFSKKYPNITIKEERLYDEAYHQKLQARLQSGNVPDIVYAWASARSSSLFQSQQAVDLSGYIDTSQYLDVVVIPKSPMKGVKEGIYVLPITLGVNSVFYVNKEVLNTLGLSVPKTYSELKAMTPRIKAAGMTPVAMANAAPWVMNSTLFGTIVARITGNPNWLQEAALGKHSFTDPDFIKSLEFVQQMYNDGVLEKKSLQVDYGAALGLFLDGKTPFMIDGHWRVGAMAENSAFLSDVEMLPFPVLPNESGNIATASAGEPSPGYTVTQNALKDKATKEAALAFISFLVGKEGGFIWAEKASFIPVLKSMDVSSIDKKDFQLKKQLYNDVKILANTPDQVLPSKVNEVLNNGLQEIGIGAKTPKEVAKALQDAM